MKKKCDLCHGSGQGCDKCFGGDIDMQCNDTCPRCNGLGFMIDQSAPMPNGTRVRVKKNQGRLGGDKYPGRFGVITGLNSIALPDRLYYVDLEPTKRAKARRETFWEKDLIDLTEDQ